MDLISEFFSACFSDWGIQNLLTYLGCVFVCQIVGMLWYGKWFGELFLRLAYPNVKTAEEKKRLNDDFSDATLAYSAAIIGSLKGMFILRALIKIIPADNCIDGAFLGYLVSVASAIFGVMHPFFENRPVRLYLLHQGYHIFCFTICGAVLAR